MVKTILVDFSRTLLFPKDKAYDGKLNPLYRSIIVKDDYTFFDHFYLNQELLNFLKLLRKKYKICVFTTDIIQNDPAIKPLLEESFSKIFVANDLGIDKRNPLSYNKLASILNEKPENILVIDDTKEKIEAAKQAGFQTIQFISNEQLFEDLKAKLHHHSL